MKQIGVAGAAADAQAKQFALDQKFGQDSRYVKELAGSYQGYAAGQAVIGAGQGMAEHGVGSGGVAGLGAQMAIGVGMGNAMAGGFTPPRRAARAGLLAGWHAGPVRQVSGRSSRAGSSAPSVAAPWWRRRSSAAAAGIEMAAGAKFCANCGTSATAGAPAPSAG